MVIIFPVLQNPYSAVFYQPCLQTAPQRTRYSAPSRFSGWYLYQTDYEVLYRLACTAAPLERLGLVVALEVCFAKARVFGGSSAASMAIYRLTDSASLSPRNGQARSTKETARSVCLSTKRHPKNSGALCSRSARVKPADFPSKFWPRPSARYWTRSLFHSISISTASKVPRGSATVFGLLSSRSRIL